MKLRSIFTTVLILSVVLVRAQTADEVIGKYLSTIGGATNWKKLTSKSSSGKMTMMGMELPVTAQAKPVNKSKMVITFQGMQIVQAFDGKTAWAVNPMGGNKEPQILTPDQAKEMVDNEFENEFIDYKKKGSTAKYIGAEDVDGTKCHKIELNRKGSTSTYFFDAENHIVLLEKSILNVEPVKGQEATTYYSDYQEVNGLLVPFFTEIKIGGQSFQRLVLEKVTFNEAIDDSVFALPKK